MKMMKLSVLYLPKFPRCCDMCGMYLLFALLKAFNTNTHNFHQYFKDKLSSHQPSNMYNTRHRTNTNFNTPLFNHSKTQKCYLYKVIPILNSLPKFLKTCSSNFTFQKQIGIPIIAMSKSSMSTVLN